MIEWLNERIKKIFKRFWPVNGYIAVLIGFMALMSALTLIVNDSGKLFAVCVVITLFAIATAALLNERLRFEASAFLNRISEGLEPRQEQALENIPVPVAVIGHKGELVWFNNKFKRDLLGGENQLGLTIKKLQRGFDMESVHASRGFETAWGDKFYGCTPIPLEGEDRGKYAVYFYEITELKLVEQKYVKSRPTVMIIVFDNEDELFKARESERMRVISEVDSLINRWVSGMSGICWLDARDKSLVVLEEDDALSLLRSQFEVLKEARQIVVEDGTPVTLSIGVGRGGSDIGECEEWALQALDMALGRGGDQAVVKSYDNFEFFGGSSDSSERQSKVRLRMLALALKEQIIKCDNCIIMGHRFTDLDSIGASIGLAALVRGCDKEALIAVNKEESLAVPMMDYYTKCTGVKPFFTPVDALDHMRDGTLLIVVDTHSPEIVESRALFERAKNVAVIDHHRMMVSHIRNPIVSIHEASASSACELVAGIAENIGERDIGKSEADALLAGIMLDTKSFLLRTGTMTFEASAFLRGRGADPVEVNSFFSDSIETYTAKSDIVSAAHIQKGYAIGILREEIPNVKIAAAEAADDMLSLNGVLASFVVFPLGSSALISARSLGKVNVQVILERLGGGGHLTMAGATLADTSIDTAIELLNDAIEQSPRA